MKISIGSMIAILSVLLSGSGCNGEDTLLQGFNGRVVEFLGQHGSVYNMLSEQQHAINARFDSTSSVPAISGVGFRFAKNQLSVACDAASPLGMSVLLNGHRLDKTSGDGQLQFTIQQAGWSMSVHLEGETTTLQLATSLMHVVLVSKSGSGPCSLLFTVTLKQTAGSNKEIHGVLGQTFRWEIGVPNRIEGELADYEVADLLSTEFRFSKFAGITMDSVDSSFPRGRNLIMQTGEQDRESPARTAGWFIYRRG